MGSQVHSDCFLDTCIYYGYATDWNPHKSGCRVIDGGAYRKHTSLTVKSELDELFRYMDRFLKEILRQGSVERALQNERNPNRRAFLSEAAKSIKCKSQEEAHYGFTLLFSTIKQSIKEALEKTAQPLIDRSKDFLLVDSLYFIGNKNDAQIIADAADWAQSRGIFFLFITTDQKDILRNSWQILQVIGRHYRQSGIIELCHVSRA
ncbi:MAG: hypothetical protein ABC596_05985 [Candidatus Methanosuratincola petrocarbonis]